MGLRLRLSLLGMLMLSLALCVGPANAHAHHPAKHHRHHHKHRVQRKHQSSQPADAPLPSMGPEPPPSLFGLNTDLFDTNHALFVADVPAARGLGARWDRFTTGPKTGDGHYRALDWQVRQARSNGMGVILSFGGISEACSIALLPADITACPPTTASDLVTYQAFVRRIVVRYRNVVDYYESWVEPNTESNFLAGPDPATYAALLTAEWQTIQSVNSEYGLHIKLLFGSPIGFSIEPGNPRWTAVLPWTQQVLDDLHGQKPFDAVGLMAYRFPPGGYGPSDLACDYVDGIQVNGGYADPDCPAPAWKWMSWPDELAAYEQLFENNGYGQQPLWLTEFGWPGNAVADGAYFPDELTQSLYLTEAYTDLLQLPFVQAAFWFNVRDYQQNLSSPDPSFFYHYGIFNYDLSPKPAALAFKVLALANPGR